MSAVTGKDARWAMALDHGTEGSEAGRHRRAPGGLREPGEQQSSGQLIGGRYRLAETIGRGSMGQVWRARDELLDRDVALKEIVFPREFDEAERNELHQRQLREARSAARLSHPAVATVFDMVEERGHPWIVMEFVPGRPLDLVLREQGPLPPHVVARIGRDLLAALAAAHAVGVLHRDVKPGNVLLTDDGGAVLADFGVATIDGDPSLTHSWVVMGTAAYSAPERIRDKPDTTASVLWSAGLTLYAASEGQGPYDACGSTSSTIAAIATEDPAPPGNAGPNAPVIMALLKRDPAARPTAEAALRMLAQAGVAPRADPAVPPLATLGLPVPEAGLAASDSAAPGLPNRKRRRGRLVMMDVAALVVLGGALWAIHQSLSRPHTGQEGLPVTIGHHGAASTARATSSPHPAGQAGVTRQPLPPKLSSGASPRPSTSPAPSAPAPGGCGTLTGGHVLTDGQSLLSCNGVYMLGMQDDGNLVLYNNSGTALWYTATMNRDPLVADASMQDNGNFVLYNTSGASVWATGTSPNDGAYLDVGNDGYVRVYSASGTVLWKSILGT